MSSTDPTPRGAGRRLVKTPTPGIYRRQRGDGSLGGYVVIYRAAGRQRKESAATLAEARAIRSARSADVARGEFQARSAVTLRAFLADWIDRYQGTGRRGFREGTRADYRRLLDAYAHAYFGERLRLVDVTPHTLAQWVSWLTGGAGESKTLADSTISNAVIPVRAALATRSERACSDTTRRTGSPCPSASASMRTTARRSRYSVATSSRRSSRSHLPDTVR